MLPSAVATSAPYPTADQILARVRPALPQAEADYVRKAYAIAEEAHNSRHQLRRSGEPYFSHCAAVTMMLAELVSDWPTLAGGLLHDVIEDCDFTVKQINSLLPAPVAELVDGVTKISKLNFGSDREHQAENLRKMILAMARDVRVVLIKLCDRLHNMRTLSYLPLPKQKTIATSTVEIYAPLAKRLGIQRISTELEDLSLHYTQPVIFQKLSEHLERNRAHYETIISKMQVALDAALVKAHIPAKVYGRIKHVYSLYKKMMRQGLVLDEVHDLIAMRVVTENVAQTYEALGIVHSRWRPVEGKFKDYIGNPKPNGYQSLHTTIIGVSGEIIEIQLRTQEMHNLAEEGIAAHWQYKEAGGPKTAQATETEKLAWLRQLVDWLTDIRDPQEFLAAVKQDVFAGSVFCYTPRGDVIEMPRGSTALDFAYRIHTEVGHRCSGAKINHKMAPLRTTLKTGDIIEILTAKSAHPTPDWLQIANNNRSKYKIRHYLKTHYREIYLERGRGMFADALRLKAPEMGPNEALEKMGAVARQFDASGAEDLLIEIGFGSVRAGAVISRMLHEGAQPQPIRRPIHAHAAQGARQSESILVDGMPGAVARLAQCCSPKPGDQILGFVTQGRGISVHRMDCASLQRSRWLHAETPNRVVGVQWGDGPQKLLKATIRVICQDRKGLLTDITQAVTQLGVNIIGAHTQSNLKTAHATIKLTVQVPDDAALNTLLKRLETIPSVRSLRRTLHHR